MKITKPKIEIDSVKAHPTIEPVWYAATTSLSVTGSLLLERFCLIRKPRARNAGIAIPGAMAPKTMRNRLNCSFSSSKPSGFSKTKAITT